MTTDFNIHQYFNSLNVIMFLNFYKMQKKIIFVQIINPK